MEHSSFNRVEVHDFGIILATGQTLSHQFCLSNSLNRPLQILDARALTPCCSTIDPLPKAISAGASIRIPVSLRVGRATGRKSVRFSLRTDDPIHPIRVFALVASLRGEVEIEELDTTGLTLQIGEPGHRVLEVVSRRVGNVGQGPPSELRADGGVSVKFTEEFTGESAGSGLTESVRRILIDIPPSPVAGMKSSSVEMTWASGLKLSHHVTWKVEPRITAHPSALILKTAREESHVLLLKSANPFRVMEIRGESLVGKVGSPSKDSKREHVLQLRTVSGSRSSASNIEITTDDPLQPLVLVSVLSLGDSEETR